MKKEAKTKKITIDDLAIMMAKSFGSLGKDVNEIKEDIRGVKKDVESVKKDVEGLKNQLEGTNRRIDDFAETKVSLTKYLKLEKRVSVLESK